MERLTCNKLKTICDGYFVNLASKEEATKYRMLAESAPKYEELYKRLVEYEDLEEQGLLVKLPCAIGTTVYAVVRECEGDSFECYHTCDTCTWSDTHIKEVIFDIEYIGDVGNWIFLTKEEAEQALAEMKGEEYGR